MVAQTVNKSSAPFIKALNADSFIQLRSKVFDAPFNRGARLCKLDGHGLECLAPNYRLEHPNGLRH